MIKDISTKKKVIWIIYILIAFSSIYYIKQKEVELKLPIIEIEEEKDESSTNQLEFEIISIDTAEINNSDKMEYIYVIKVENELDDYLYSTISCIVLDNLKKEYDFENLSLTIMDKNNRILFKFIY